MNSFEKRKEKSELQGLLRGIGISVYIEATAGGVPETSKIEVNSDGTIDVYTGALAQGQARNNIFTNRFYKFGIDIDKINFFQGNSNLLSKGEALVVLALHTQLVEQFWQAQIIL